MNRIDLQVCGLAILLVISVIAPLSAQEVNKSSSKTYKPGPAIEGLKNPTKLILYRIGGQKEMETKGKDRLIDPEATFAGYPILDKVELTDQAKRDELIAVLQDAVVNHGNDPLNCFSPGRAIFAVENEKTFEIVICFKCAQYKLNGKGFPLINRRAAAKFESYLTSRNATTAK